MRFPITFVFVFGKGFAAGVVKMANRRTLRLLSDSQNDQLVMKSLLNIVGNRASTRWVYPDCDGYDSKNADVILIDTNVMPTANNSALKAQYHAEIVVAYGSMLQKSAAFDFLLPKPVRSKDLLLLLNDLEAKLSQYADTDVTAKFMVDNTIRTKVVTPQTPTPALASMPSTTPAKLVDGLLALSKQYKAAMLEVRVNGQVYAYLDNYRKKAFVNPLFLKDVPIGKLGSRVVDSMPQNNNFKAVTFTDLFFDLTLSQPPAVLVEGLSTDDTFSIKQWPNMGNSVHAKSMVRIAAYFSKQQATLAKATRDLSVEMNQIVGFINAVHSQNLLTYSSSVPTVTKMSIEPKQDVVAVVETIPVKEAPAKSSGIGGLFGRIRQRLGI